MSAFCRLFVLKNVKLAAEKERRPLHKAEAEVVALTKELEGGDPNRH